MTHLVPCHRCPIGQNCALRREMRAKIKGLGLRRAEFDCPKIAAELRPGRRIVITRPVVREYVNVINGLKIFGKVVDKVLASATILRPLPGLKFHAVVDPGQAPDVYRFRKPMKHSQIKAFIVEPDRKICRCGFAIGPDGTPDRGQREEHTGLCEDVAGPSATNVAKRMGVLTCSGPIF